MIDINWTVGEAVEYLRRNPPPEQSGGFSVSPAGVVSSRDLLLSPPERPVREITTPEGQDDLFQAVGVHADHPAPGAFGAFRRRLPWLGANMAGGVICAFLASAFEHQLSRVVALAMFIPVVLNLAESVSSQSVSITLHMLHTRPPSLAWIRRSLPSELWTGTLLGLVCGASIAAVALAWLRHPVVALCLLGGIGGGVAVSALLGMAMPVVLRLVKLDPKVAAGPIALAAADIVTLGLYLGLARWLIE